MKLTITATNQITHVNGAPCRVWEGVTERGVPCKVFVHRLAVRADLDSAEFDAELSAQLPPIELVVDLRRVLP